MTTKTSEKLEIVQPGQLRKSLQNAFKAGGNKITDQMIRDSFVDVEQARFGFQASVIRLGTLLLMKKATIRGRGKWGAYLDKVIENGNALPFSQVESIRGLRTYMQTAKQFFLWLDNHQDNENCASIEPGDVAQLTTLPEARLSIVTEALDRFVGGRSLRKMLTEFRYAQQEAVKDEQEEQDILEQDQNGPNPQPTREQLIFNFKEEIFSYLQEADKLVFDGRDPRISMLSKKDIRDLYEYHHTSMLRLKDIFGDFDKE